MTCVIAVGNVPEGVLRAAEKHSHMGSMKVNYTVAILEIVDLL